MGCEIGQFTEWDYKSSVEWFLLSYPMHEKFQHFVSSLNNFYLGHSELWELDDSWDGFEWLEPDDRDRSVISYCRKNKKGDTLAVVINFTPVEYTDYLLAVPFEGRFRAVLSSAEEQFGGNGAPDSSVYASENAQTRSGYGIRIKLPPYGAVIFKCRRMRKRTQKSQENEETQK